MDEPRGKIRLRRATAFIGAVGLCAASLTACGSSSSVSTQSAAASGTTSHTSAAPIRVGLLEVGAKNDGGYNSTFTQAATELERTVPNVKVTIVDNTNPGAQTQQVASQLATQGYQLIIGSGTGMDADLAKVAPKYSHTKFVAAFGPETGPNFSEMSFPFEQGRYLDGIVAGLETKKNVIGYVAGYPVPDVQRPLDAFALGVHAVNSKAVVKVLFVNSWYDPSKEHAAASALVSAGADVLGMDANSPAVGQAAETAGVGFIGYGISRETTAPQSWLTSFTFNWEPYFAEFIRQIRTNTWRSSVYYWGLKQGVVGQAAFGPRVTPQIRAKVAAAKRALEAGTLHVFTGPIVSNKGKTVVAAGKALTTTGALNDCCSFLVQGIEG